MKMAIYIGKTGFETFMVSKDNGDTWQYIEWPYSANVLKILCVGNDTIFVSLWLTGGAQIIRSYDSGENWELCNITGNASDYVTDIAISGKGELYVSVSAWFEDMCGVYKSSDYGSTWEYVGLLNHQVMTVEINSRDEVFTGDWWVMNYSENPGIHGLYEGSSGFELLMGVYHATDIVITSEDYIYAAEFEGIVRSFDNGQSFEYIEDPLSTVLEELHIDHEGYLYASNNYGLVKSLQLITTGVDINNYQDNLEYFKLHPNPAHDNVFVKTGQHCDNNKIYQVNIYDLFGNRVSQKMLAFKMGRLNLNVSDLNNGLYFIEIHDTDNVYTLKFLKR